ncbi:proline-specific peptidase [Apiospora arundinis]|uniref:Proline-specific peptidase n=1 Tax=Apiospora arundinis TaxID=335852 RepID=A0ABR2HSB3_9PEZI
MVHTEEGTAEFKVAGLDEPCKTWYKVVGNLDGSKTPLFVLHGGPGASHDYLLPLTDLASSVPVVFYDQIGNGQSTHLPDKNGDEKFWTVELFMDELDNLIRHLGLQERPIDVYGHSWGGMLVAQWAGTPSRAANLRRLVITSGLTSMDIWRKNLEILKGKLPQDVQDALDRAEEKKEFDTPEYEAAVEVFYKRHLSLERPYPSKEVQVALDTFAKDTTVYGTMYGPSEICITGSLRDWTCIPLLGNIRVPTLLMNGSDDEVQDMVMQPLFDRIQKVKWVTLDGAAHFLHSDQRQKHMQHVEAFLTT